MAEPTTSPKLRPRNANRFILTSSRNRGSQRAQKSEVKEGVVSVLRLRFRVQGVQERSPNKIESTTGQISHAPYPHPESKINTGLG